MYIISKMFLSNCISKALMPCTVHKSILRSVHILAFDMPVLRKRTNLYSIKASSMSCSYIHSNVNCSVYKKESTLSRIESNKSTFQKMLHFRKKQAQRSVLLELSKKEDIPFAINTCERFGVLKKVFSYSGESKNVYILLEFDVESSVHKLIHSSCYKNISDAFPVLSRIIGFDKKCEEIEPKMSVTITENESVAPSFSKQGTISDLIENIYMTEKLSELNVRLRFFFCSVLNDLLSGLFPHADAIPFGSSVNGIGRHGCDLDLMIRLYPEKVGPVSELYFVNKTCVGDIQNLQRRAVSCIGDLLRTFSPGVASMQKILYARVPIVKLDHKILGMKIDISVNNVAPILMSELLHLCGEIDSRIRPLIYAVKKWAREANVTYDVAGSWITNFALSILVIFFVQNRQIPILPPLCEVVNIKGEECTAEYEIEYLIPLAELQTKASLNKESLAILLKEFLAFLGSHPFKNKHISILTGLATEKKIDNSIWIQYPLEEDMNVSKNVSEFELQEMCEKAHISSKHLGANLNLKGSSSKDLSVLLGIPNLRKIDANKSKGIDVSTLLGEDVKSSNKKSGRRRAF